MVVWRVLEGGRIVFYIEELGIFYGEEVSYGIFLGLEKKKYGFLWKKIVNGNF